MKRIMTGAILTVLLLMALVPASQAQGFFAIRSAASTVLNEGIAIPEPHQASVFFDDFFQLDANGANNAGWIVTAVGTSPVVVTDEAFGIARIITGGTENNGDNIQWNAEIFRCNDEKVSFEARVKVSEAAQSDFILGLLITDTTAIDTTTVTDGICFKSIDGDSLLVAEIIKNSTAIKDTMSTVVEDDTWLELRFEVINKQVTYFVNGKREGQTARADSTSVPDDEELTPTIAFETGAAAAETLYTDYVWARQER